MKIDKLKKYESKKQSPITVAEHRANAEIVTDLIMSVIDHLPANPQPVSQTYAELLAEMRSGVSRQTTLIDSGLPKVPPNK